MGHVHLDPVGTCQPAFLGIDNQPSRLSRRFGCPCLPHWPRVPLSSLAPGAVSRLHRINHQAQEHLGLGGGTERCRLQAVSRLPGSGVFVCVCVGACEDQGVSCSDVRVKSCGVNKEQSTPTGSWTLTCTEPTYISPTQ